MRRILLTLVCILMLSASGYGVATRLARPTPERMQAVYETVGNARIFSVGGVGIAAVRSPEEVAFLEMLAQPEPVARCQSLLAEGTPAAQMYALLGLSRLDQKEFRAALPRYKDAKAEVPTAAGCLVTNDNTSAIAQRIAWGIYR